MFKLIAFLMLGFVTSASAAKATHKKKIPPQRCAVNRCKSGFDSTTKSLSKDRTIWTGDIESALKTQGVTACLQEVKEIEQRGSTGVSGCEDCTYGIMGSMIQKEISSFADNEAPPEEMGETKKNESEEKTKYSKTESLSSVFSKLRTDVISDLKEKCNPTVNKNQPKAVNNNNSNNSAPKSTNSGY